MPWSLGMSMTVEALVTPAELEPKDPIGLLSGRLERIAVLAVWKPQ
jgi:hypothetical protein